MYEERERIGKEGEYRAQCAEGEDQEREIKDKGKKVTNRKKSRRRGRRTRSAFSPAFLFFLSLSLPSNLFSPGLKSDIHHSRVPQTIYLECQRHENR